MAVDDDILLLTTDRNLTVVGDPIDTWTSVEAVQRFNAPGSGQFTAPATRRLLDFLTAVAPGGNWLLDQILPSYRIVMIRGDEVFSAGPIETWNYTEDDDAAAGGVVTVTWAEDLALIAGRITYPDPTAAANAQTATARWSSTAVAETLMHSLVNANAGPGALTARRVAALTMGTDHSAGASLTWSTRFQPLADDLRAIALAGGGLGFRTRQVGTDIVFETYDPADLTGAVRFSRGLGNLRSASLTITAPTVTSALVAGQGEGTARTIRERTSASAEADWFRLESFVDRRDTNVSGELDQAGDGALAEGAEAAKLESTTVDIAGQQFGIDFGLGDLVSIEVWPGRDVADVVRTATLNSTEEAGTTVEITIGDQESVTEPALVRRLRDLDRRITNLEVT